MDMDTDQDFEDDGEWDDDAGDGDWDDDLNVIDAATMTTLNTIDVGNGDDAKMKESNGDNGNVGDIVLSDKGMNGGMGGMGGMGGDGKSGMSGVQRFIPKLTHDALTSNCMEINMIPMFVAKADLKSRARIGALVGIQINKLTNLTIEQLEVWGITPNFKYLTFKFEFGPHYLNEGQTPSLQVGLSEKFVWEEPLKQFRLSWTIGERIKNSLLDNEHWTPGSNDMSKIPDCGKINELMESTQQEYCLCLEALISTKFDVSNALNLLLDESQIKRLKKKLKPNAESQAKFEEILNKVWDPNNTRNDFGDEAKNGVNGVDYVSEYESVDDSKKLKQLMDMFGISNKVAKYAFNSYGYDECIAKLSDESEKNAMIAMVQSVEDANNDKVSDFFQNYSQNDPNNPNNNNNNNQNASGFGNKLKTLMKGRNNDSNNNNSSSNNDELDEKHVNDGLSELMQIKRTESQSMVQECGREDITRSMARMMDHNWLLRVLCFGLKVLLNGNKYCMICDKQLEFAGLKPSICDKPFCQFRHDEMELGFSLCDELLFRPQLTDLLISLMYAACKTNRYQEFFPSGVRADTINIDTTSPTSATMDSAAAASPDNTNNTDATDSTNTTTSPDANNNNINNNNNNNFYSMANASKEWESFMTDTGVADAQRVLSVLDDCPAVDELSSWAALGKKYLKQQCYEKHPLLYGLLSWIITSNRSHLKLLSEDERISDISTPYQFALCSSTPSREAAFQMLQHRNGSFLAWHGSGFGNWHSIMRMGLKNYSGTKHQLNGQAYGPGIYLAKNFSLSWGYCRNGAGMAWPQSQFGSTVNCMSLCEVVYHDDDVAKHRHENKSASAVDLFQLANNKRNSLNNVNSSTSSSSSSSSSSSKKKVSRVSSHTRMTDPNNKWVKTSGIYVVDSEEHVITRFFFIFANATYNQSGAKVQDANDLNIPKVVKSFG